MVVSICRKGIFFKVIELGNSLIQEICSLNVWLFTKKKLCGHIRRGDIQTLSILFFNWNNKGIVILNRSIYLGRKFVLVTIILPMRFSLEPILETFVLFWRQNYTKIYLCFFYVKWTWPSSEFGLYISIHFFSHFSPSQGLHVPFLLLILPIVRYSPRLEQYCNESNQIAM